MTRAARKAAPRLRRDFGEVEQLQVSKKGPGDFVSMADKRAEATVVEELRNARLYLASAVKVVLASGLKLLGVGAPETM